jgi:hypothetical protein
MDHGQRQLGARSTRAERQSRDRVSSLPIALPNLRRPRLRSDCRPTSGARTVQCCTVDSSVTRGRSFGARLGGCVGRAAPPRRCWRSFVGARTLSRALSIPPARAHLDGRRPHHRSAKIGADFQQKRISRSLSYLKAIIAHQNLAVSPTNRYLPSTSYTPAAMLPFTSSGLATKPMTGGFLSVRLLTPSLMWRCSVASMPVSRSR